MSALAAMRRGACPSLPAPMRTGDGLLARLQPGEPLTLDQLAGLARLAAGLGNGIVEVTARGKLQLRGLSETSAPRLPAAVAGLGIAVPDGFPVEVSALAGLDPTARFDPRPLTRAIAAGAAKLVPHLAPKASVVVDGGGWFRLGGLKADVGLTAGSGAAVLVSLAGKPCGELAAEEAPAVVVALLEELAARGKTARMAASVEEEGIEALRMRFGLAPSLAVPGAGIEPVGLHALPEDTFVLGVGLAFGQVEAAALDGLAQAAGRAGVRHVEPVAGRGLLLVGVARERVDGLRDAAAAGGFITDPADPRRRIFACAGRPACGSARLETHALAAALAPLAKEGDAPASIHVSGCAKGCAHPAAAALTIVGLDEGAGLVVEGSPRDLPARIVPVARLREAARDVLKKDTA